MKFIRVPTRVIPEAQTGEYAAAPVSDPRVKLQAEVRMNRKVIPVAEVRNEIMQTLPGSEEEAKERLFALPTRSSLGFRVRVRIRIRIRVRVRVRAVVEGSIDSIDVQTPPNASAPPG